MSVSIFGLTAASVRAHMFPQWKDFSVNSSPTAVIVGEIITEEAGELAAKLYGENVNAAAITDTASAAYLWCTKTLRLMVALRVLRASTQQEPELNKAYAAELKKRFEDLAAGGATALGNDSLDTGDSPADGPTTHINQFGLTTLAAEDMSALDDGLKRSDKL